MTTPVPTDDPVTFRWHLDDGRIEPFVSRDERRVSHLGMMFADAAAVARAIEAGDPVVYEILYQPFVTSTSDLAIGVTRLEPGTVGDEYHMTKGHFHVREDAAEIYFCQQGEGYLLLQSRAGEFRAIPWSAGSITHFSSDWAHRVVNTGPGLLVFSGSYHYFGGLDYAPIIEKGFRQRVMRGETGPMLVDDARWGSADHAVSPTTA